MENGSSLNIRQKIALSQEQFQTQKLSQNQLQSLKILAMGTEELRGEIYLAAAKNPALEIEIDSSFDDAPDFQNADGSDGGFEFSKKKYSDEESDKFQRVLESSADERKSLYDHLSHQFLSVPHSAAQEKLGLKIIHNLDSRGFHILSPYSLADKKNPKETARLVEETVAQIQQLDPVGTACKDFRESLFVQAKIRGDAPECALFILDGNFDLLSPPQIQKIQKKVNECAAKTAGPSSQKKCFSAAEIEAAVEYIKTLDPFPARDFSSAPTNYIIPDVYVEQDEETKKFFIRGNERFLPKLKIADDFQALSSVRSRITKSTEESERLRSEHKFVMESVQRGEAFIESVNFRKQTVLRACREILFVQEEFFEKGPAFLKPLRQKDIAQKLGVHEATISRMARGKYISCPQGIFKIGYFFSNGVETSSKSAQGESGTIAKNSVLFELKSLLDEHKNDKKNLSDQKIADLLESKGIKISRRTVAKYRAQLNINSSYTR